MSSADIKNEEILVSKPLSALEMIAEWRKGCTCGGPMLDRLEGQPEGTSSPWECQECTVGLIEAMERNLKRTSVWQPIETAPKDGTAILIFDPNAYVFQPGDHPRVSVAGLSNGEWHLCDYDPGYGETEQREVKPSHWMPLPAPPI